MLRTESLISFLSCVGQLPIWIQATLSLICKQVQSLDTACCGYCSGRMSLVNVETCWDDKNVGSVGLTWTGLIRADIPAAVRSTRHDHWETFGAADSTELLEKAYACIMGICTAGYYWSRHLGDCGYSRCTAHFASTPAVGWCIDDSNRHIYLHDDSALRHSTIGSILHGPHHHDGCVFLG